MPTLVDNMQELRNSVMEHLPSTSLVSFQPLSLLFSVLLSPSVCIHGDDRSTTLITIMADASQTTAMEEEVDLMETTLYCVSTETKLTFFM